MFVGDVAWQHLARYDSVHLLETQMNVRSPTCVDFLCSLLLLSQPLTAQRVWVVAPTIGPGIDFVQIQPAVDAAVDGDTVLVRAGTYTAFLISGKSLTVAADGVTVSLTSQREVGIRNVSATQAVVVRGFSLFRNGPSVLAISDCIGPVSIEDCNFGINASSNDSAASLSNARSVTFLRCFLGGTTVLPASGGHGLLASSSTIAFHDCGVRATPSLREGSPGPAGMVLNRSFAYAAGTTIVGGDGGPGRGGGGYCPSPPGQGGPAVQMSGSEAVFLECQITPGGSGFPGYGCPPAPPNVPIVGSATILAGTAGSFATQPVVRMGQPLSLVMRGPVGVATWLAFSARLAPTFVLPCNGVLHVDLSAATILFAGFMPPGGALAIQIPVPALGVLGATVHVQMGMTDPSGCFLGSPSAVAVVDSRY